MTALFLVVILDVRVEYYCPDNLIRDWLSCAVDKPNTFNAVNLDTLVNLA